ncbi:hypothetical protein RB597_010320 [Gaeumannomyces tritici]
MSNKKKYVVTLDDDDLKNAPESVVEYLRKKGALKPTDDVSAPSVPLQAEDDASRDHTARHGAREREQLTTQLSRLLKSPQARLVLPDVLKQVGLPFDGISKEEPFERSEFAALLRLRAENDQRKAALEELRAELRAEQDQAKELEAEIQRLKRQNRTSRTGGPGEQQQIEEQANQDPVVAELLAKLDKQGAELAELKRQRTADTVRSPRSVPVGQTRPDDAEPSQANAERSTSLAASTADAPASSPAATPRSNSDGLAFGSSHGAPPSTAENDFGDEGLPSGSSHGATPSGSENDPGDSSDEELPDADPLPPAAESPAASATKAQPDPDSLPPLHQGDSNSEMAEPGSSSSNSGNGDGGSSNPSTASSPPSDRKLSSNQTAESAAVPALQPRDSDPSTSAQPGDPSHSASLLINCAQSGAGRSDTSSSLSSPPDTSDLQVHLDPGPDDIVMGESETQKSDGCPHPSPVTRPQDPVPIVHLDEMPSPKRQIFQLPRLTGPYRCQLEQLINAYKTKFSMEEILQFRPGKFMGKWVILELLENVMPNGYCMDGRPCDLKKTPRLRGFVKAYFVNLVNQLSDNDEKNHWVIAIIDLIKGEFIGWGMTDEMLERSAKVCEAELKECNIITKQGQPFTLARIARELGDYSDNTCALRCVEAVRIHFGQARELEPDNVVLRLDSLKRWIELENKKAAEALGSSNHQEDRDQTLTEAELAELAKLLEIEPRSEASSQQQVSTAEAAPGSPSEPLSQRDAGAAAPDAACDLVDQAKNDGAATSESPKEHAFTPATFAVAEHRTKLPTGRPRPVAPPPSNIGASQAPSPQSSNSGNTTPPASDVLDGVSYTWMTPESGGHQKTTGGRVLLLKPTPEQYKNLFEGPDHEVPLLFDCAEKLGARQHGVCVIDIPEASRTVLPEQRPFEGQCTTYEPEDLGNGFVRFCTNHNRIRNIPSTDRLDHTVNIDTATQQYRDLLSSTTKTLQYEDLSSTKKRDVAYKTDIPAHTAKERKDAFVPEQSPIYPIRGNQLPPKGVPGINTPTAFRGTPFSPFGWHFEDWKLGAVNCLYCGNKVWRVTEPGSFETATTFFKELVGQRANHDQFMRHESYHQGIEQMQASGIEMRGFVQSAWQIVVVYPGVYHSGFSVTGTLAEAVNYADNRWTEPKGYRPCLESCDPGHQPVTLDQILPNGHKGQRTDNERRTDDEQHEDDGQQTNTAGRRTSMGTEAKAQQIAPSLQKDTGGEQRSADEQHSGDQHRDEVQHVDQDQHEGEKDRGEEQQTKTAGLRRSGRKSQGALYPTESVAGRKRSRPESADGTSPKRISTQSTNVPTEVLANELTCRRAKERIRRHLLAWIDDPALTVPDEGMGWGEKTSQYLALGGRWRKRSAFSKMVALTLETHALERMYLKDWGTDYAEGGKLRRLNSDTMAEVRGERDEKAFKDEIHRLRTFLKLGLEYLPFIPFDASEEDIDATFRDFERLTDKQTVALRKHLNHTAGKTMVRLGRAFRKAILTDDKSTWTHLEPEDMRTISIDDLLGRLSIKEE